ncbi:MAG: PQQ-binding-like beta-propeller repeat protein, partial [Thermoflexales bacterium]
WGGRLQVLWRTLDGTVFSQSLHLGALTTETLSSTPVIRSSPLLADFGEGMTAVFGWMPDANNGAQARLSAVRLSVNTLSGTAVFTPTWTRFIDDWKSSPALVPMGPDRPPLVVTGYGIGLGANQGTGGYGVCNNVNGGILAMNVLSGTVAWTHDWAATGDGNVRGSPAVADFDGDGGMDVALPAGCFGKLYGYDGATGAPKWERQLGPRTIGSPSLGDLNGDRALEIVVGSYDGNVWALTSPRWAFVPGAFR